MKEEWTVIEDWLEENHETGTDVLNPPATDEEIEEVEDALGVDLPSDFVSFLQIHNGQTSESRRLLRLYRLFPTDDIIRFGEKLNRMLDDGEFEGNMLNRQQGPDEEIQKDWWNDQWVPFAQDADGNLLCLDLDPTPEGDHGQVISVRFDMALRAVKNSSFEKWFSMQVFALKEGDYVYSDSAPSLMAYPSEA